MLRSLLAPSLAALVLTVPVGALDTLRVGLDAPIDWDGTGAAIGTLDPEYRSLVNPNVVLIGNAPGELIDFAQRVLAPRQLQEGENIAAGTLARGGTIAAPTVLRFTADFTRTDLAEALAEILSDLAGGETQAFERKSDDVRGTLIIGDLGGRFGVNRFRFYPRNTVHPAPTAAFQNDFLRAFELFVNDGINLTADGFPLWGAPIVEEAQNTQPVVDLEFDPPRYIRSFRLRSATPIPFEIDEIEIYGTGFLPAATYFSDIFATGLAAWGRIRWVEKAVGDSAQSSLLIATRSGNDDTPFIFHRQRTDKRTDPEIPFSIADPTQPMRLAEYERLPVVDANGVTWAKGSIKDDLEHWSPWSPPYPLDEGTSPHGTPIISPSPRRFLQFRVSAQSNDIHSARRLERISLSYLTPPLADEFVAEIFPRQVAASTSTSFTYAVRMRMNSPNLLGFDTFAIHTPIRVEQVEQVEILNAHGELLASHAFAQGDTVGGSGLAINAIAADRFSVRFPRIQADGSLLKIAFRSAVLAFSTEFRGQASLSSEPGSFQNATSGNSTDLDAADQPTHSGTTVLSPSIIRSTRLIDALELTPNPFTPNRDGINDQVAIAYNILALTEAGAVAVRLYDLSGRLVHTLQQTALRNGRYALTWDGRAAGGQLVPPGVYLLGVTVAGDQGDDLRVHPLSVAY